MKRRPNSGKKRNGSPQPAAKAVAAVWAAPWWRTTHGRGGWKKPSFMVGAKPEKAVALEWVGWFYELMSRDAGQYLLGLAFDRLPPAARGFLCDKLAASVVKAPAVESPIAPADEIREATAPDQWPDGTSISIWSEAYCFDLERSDSEIVDAVRELLRRQRPRARRHRWNKGAPWKWVDAHDIYRVGTEKRTPYKTARWESKKWIHNWKAVNGELVAEVISEWNRLYTGRIGH